jgi:aspartate-semialdehyde dehydrogenase
MSRKFDIAVVGATTLVGEQLLDLLKDREFPVGKVHVVAADLGAGTTAKFGNRDLPIEELAGFDFSTVQLAFFAAGAAASAAHAAKAAVEGCVVIDCTSQFRNDPDVPLVIPEVNGEALAGYGTRGIVANPTCSTIQMLVALKPLHDAAGIERINVCTMQSVSGAGREAVEELGRQTADLLNFRDLTTTVLPRQIAFNVIPQVGSLDGQGSSSEERALVDETRRILDDASIAISATAVRVPVFYGHSEAIHIETRRKLGAEEARALLEAAPGIGVIDRNEDGGYPTAVGDASGEDTVLVGRIREDLSLPNGLDLWVVSDNLRKGAALNAVQIAEALVRSYL